MCSSPTQRLFSRLLISPSLSKKSNHRFLDPHQVAPRLGPRKPLTNKALNSANAANWRSRCPQQQININPTNKPTTLNHQEMVIGRRSMSTGAGPPTSHAVSPENNTRRTRRQTTREEIEAMPNAVKDIESAEKYLSSKLLCHINEPFTLTHLISCLFHITQISSAIPLPVTTAIRAVAFIMKKHAACEIAEAAAHHLSDTLSPRIVDHVIASIAPQVAKILIASESLAKSMEESELNRATLEKERTEKEQELSIAADRIQDAADTIFSSVEDCQNAISLLSPSLNATQERLNTLSKQIPSSSTTQALPSTPSHPPKPSYSSIAAAQLQPSTDRAVGRAAIRARQILLDPIPGNTLFPPEALHNDIVKKLKTALSSIRAPSTPEGDIRAVQVHRNGGIIIELDNEHIAEWLRTPTGQSELVKQLDSSVSFRNRTYPIVVEYLPIQTQIEQEGFLRQVEHENTLPPESLASIRWIKAPTRRSKEQRKAFALLHTTDADVANNILRDGLCINNQRITIRKDKKEPLRCAKCQHYGHIARNCKATHDTCGTCGGQHRTANCTAYRTVYCVVCRSHNHASWGRTCPEFKKRCTTLNDNFPENNMPYFPSDASWTQVTKPVSPARRAPTPSNSPPSKTNSPTTLRPSRTPSTAPPRPPPAPTPSLPSTQPPPLLRQTTLGFTQQPLPPLPPQRPTSPTLLALGLGRPHETFASPFGPDDIPDRTDPSVSHV